MLIDNYVIYDLKLYLEEKLELKDRRSIKRIGIEIMKRFIIGQFGKFDFNKQQRDFRDEFWGIEATYFEKEEDIEVLRREVDKLGIGLGIHFPLRQSLWRLRDPQYLSKDSEIKKQSLEYMDKEFKFLESLKPEYILTHYPKPVILDDKVDWTNWRFADATEYYMSLHIAMKILKLGVKNFLNGLVIRDMNIILLQF